MLKIIREIKFVNIFWVLFYFLLFGLLLRGGFSYLDPDFGWHLKVGEEIIASYQVPHANPYNYTYVGNWVDHEWLSNAVIALIYHNLGYGFLVVLFALLIILVLVLLNYFVRYKLGNKPPFWLMAGLQLFGVLASLPHLGLRIQELALLFIIILLIIIENYSKTKNWRILILLPIIFFFWANLHASFLIGFFIIFSWLGITLFERFIVHKTSLHIFNVHNLVAPQQIKFFSMAALASLVVTFLTPYKLELYGFLAGYQNKAYLSLIQEWLPQYSFPFHYDQLIYLALGLSALFIYLFFKLKHKQSLETWKIFLSFVFLILSFKSRRHFPLFFVVSFVFMVDVFNEFFTEIKIAYANWLKGLFIFCISLAIAAQFITLKMVKNPFVSFCADYPCEAVNFLKSQPQYVNYNIFNNYGWGGFLIYVLPERQIFIDGRLPQVKFADWTFIQEYYSFFVGDNHQAQKLEEYDIKLVILKTRDKDVFAKKWEKIFFKIKDSDLKAHNKLREYLETSSAWKIVYQDETAKIYIRN